MVSRTTFWMDVLSSVTLCRRPRFLPTYRLLFGPDRTNGANGVGHFDSNSGFDMSEVMGASNCTLLAIAEIAELAHWKDTQTKEGLDAVELVRRGMNIQQRCLRQTTAGIVGRDGEREAVKEVFRYSAIAYLHSVLSGCHPRVPDIQNAVAGTIANLKVRFNTPLICYDYLPLPS